MPSNWVADDSPPSRMRLARNGTELVLLGMREIRVEFDRKGVAQHLQQALFYLYRAMDASPDSLVQPESLGVATNELDAARETFQRTAKRRVPQIDRALDILSDARTHASCAAEAVSMDQLDRRMQLRWGLEKDEPVLRPFRTSNARPQLHALRRDPLVAPIDLGQADPEKEVLAKAELAKVPANLDELRNLAKDIFAQADDSTKPKDHSATAPDDPNAQTSAGTGATEIVPKTSVQASPHGERAFLAAIGRDVIENIASLGSLRHPIETESWLDQDPFEQRLLNQLDYFASLGEPGVSAAVAYHGESDTPDPARAFALAFALGCLDGTDTIFAIVALLRQSAPEEYLGYIEGLSLATNENIPIVLRQLLFLPNPKLVGVALAALAARSALTRADVDAALASGDREIRLTAVKALRNNLPASEAKDLIGQQLDDPSDPELYLAGIESGLCRAMNEARSTLRDLAKHPNPEIPIDRVGTLLGICGSSRDFEPLLNAARNSPSPLLFEGIGRFGHVKVIPFFLEHLDEPDENLSPAAAGALYRITGADLFDEAEEPWVKELPPEVAGMDIPIPMKKVRRLSTDPVRWREWLAEHFAQADENIKYRHGKPFELSQIVDELEASEPQPDQRARAALEYCANAGQDFGFSPNDWVSAQRSALAMMRDQAQNLAIAHGAWCFSGAGRSVTPMSAGPVAQPAPTPDEAVVESPNIFELPTFLRKGILASSPEANQQQVPKQPLPKQQQVPKQPLPKQQARLDDAAALKAPAPLVDDLSGNHPKTPEPTVDTPGSSPPELDPFKVPTFARGWAKEGWAKEKPVPARVENRYELKAPEPAIRTPEPAVGVLGWPPWDKKPIAAESPAAASAQQQDQQAPLEYFGHADEPDSADDDDMSWACWDFKLKPAARPPAPMDRSAAPAAHQFEIPRAPIVSQATEFVTPLEVPKHTTPPLTAAEPAPHAAEAPSKAPPFNLPAAPPVKAPPELDTVDLATPKAKLTPDSPTLFLDYSKKPALPEAAPVPFEPKANVDAVVFGSKPKPKLDTADVAPRAQPNFDTLICDPKAIPNTAKVQPSQPAPHPPAAKEPKLSLDALALLESELEFFPSQLKRILDKHLVSAEQLEIDRVIWATRCMRDSELYKTYTSAVAKYLAHLKMIASFR